MAPSVADVPPLDTYQAVVAAYSDFLTVAIHNILFERQIYPPESFIRARKYNYAVRQNRHPKVCKWITDAVAAVEREMLRCSVGKTSVIIMAPNSDPVERYVFSTASFPRVSTSELLTPFTPDTIGDPDSPSRTHAKDLMKPQPSQTPQYPVPPTQDLPEQFRATLARLGPSISRLSPLPPDCTFNIAIELREQDPIPPPPLWRGEGGWIAAEPRLQRSRPGMVLTSSKDSDVTPEQEAEMIEYQQSRKAQGRDLGGVRTTPVRALEAGAFAMEVWIEEGRSKFKATVHDAG